MRFNEGYTCPGVLIHIERKLMQAENMWVGLPTPFDSWKPYLTPDQSYPTSEQNG